MSAKLRVKANGIEVEWEGDVEFLRRDLPKLISSIVAALGLRSDSDSENERSGHRNERDHKVFTTAALAARSQPRKAPELFKVALAKLQLSDGMPSASLIMILDEMKTATVYWKPAIPKNIAKSIQIMLKNGEIERPARGHYMLAQPEADRLYSLA